MNKKDVVIVVLATLCLTVTLFSIIPVMSGPQYDPWKDVNDDGVIDVKEYQIIKNAIPSVGDPTKDVRIQHGTCSWNTSVNMAGNTSLSISNSTVGYEQMYVSAKSNLSLGCYAVIDLLACFAGVEYRYLGNLSAYSYGPAMGGPYPIVGDMVKFCIYNGYNGSYWMPISIPAQVNLTVSLTTSQALFEPQKVEVANLPSLEPRYSQQIYTANCSWTLWTGSSYVGYTSCAIYIGGYSRMTIHIELLMYPILSASMGTYQVNHTLNNIAWREGRGSSFDYETPPKYRITASASQGSVIGWSRDYDFPIIQTKASWVDLYFGSECSTNPGWMFLEITVYLRQE